MPKIITTVAELFEVLTGKGVKPELLVSENKEPCPKCQLTLTEFNKTGKFGCPYCYTHYREEFLAVSLPHQDGGCHHVGKSPKKSIKEAHEYDEKLKLLRLKLAKAKEMERYEEAAKLKLELDEHIKQKKGE